jgi:cytochrome c553
MKKLPLLLTTVCLASAATSLPAVDGKTLHQKNCTSCHDDSMYTRENPRVTTIDGLSSQVRRCELALGLKWFDEDIDAVVNYLNNNYYHFE